MSFDNETPTLDRLSDRDVLTVILERTLASGAEAVAEELFRQFGGLRRTLGAPLADLYPICIDAETALDLKLVFELAIRFARAEVQRRDVLSSWCAVETYLKLGLAHRSREVFRVLFLDKKNQLLADEVLNEGSLDHAPVYPREVVRRALELSAAAMILVHNHPSGDPTPSQADIEMTRRVVDAARSLDIKVHDHVIVGADQVASFRAMGLL